MKGHSVRQECPRPRPSRCVHSPSRDRGEQDRERQVSSTTLSFMQIWKSLHNPSQRELRIWFCKVDGSFSITINRNILLPSVFLLFDCARVDCFTSRLIMIQSTVGGNTWSNQQLSFHPFMFCQWRTRLRLCLFVVLCWCLGPLRSSRLGWELVQKMFSFFSDLFWCAPQFVVSIHYAAYVIFRISTRKNQREN